MESHSDAPDQKEHSQYPWQQQAVRSTTIPEYSRGLAVLTKNAIHSYHQACPSRSCPRAHSCSWNHSLTVCLRGTIIIIELPGLIPYQSKTFQHVTRDIRLL